MGEMRNAYILIGKSDGNRPLGRPRDGREGNGRMYLGNRGWEGVE